ncbi:MAG: TolC family protein [Pseudomonadota bacterium]
MISVVGRTVMTTASKTVSGIMINKKIFFTLVCIAFCVFSMHKVNAQVLNIAVIETAGQDSAQANITKAEIKSLFEGERKVNFIAYPLAPDASDAEARTILAQASADQNTDIVLVLDVAANQRLGLAPAFAKPTFMPYVFNARLVGLPLTANATSGKTNLNYLTFDFDFEKELTLFQSVAAFRNAVLIADPSIQNSLSAKMVSDIKQQASEAGVNLSILGFTGDVDQVMAALPATTDAVLYGFFPRATRAQTKLLFESVNQRNIASFSLVGEEYVRLGALATSSPTTDWNKLSRRTALHIEEVLLGRPAAQLPVFFETSNRLMINMATSRQIRIAPNFDVLSEALLINPSLVAVERNYSLTQVARIAVRENLSLAAQRIQVEIANQSVKQVRSALLPQLNSSIEYSSRKDDSAGVRAGTLAENSTDGSLTLVQSLFDEALWAAFDVEKYSALSERELLREIELDVIQSAVQAYLQVLLAKTSLEQERYNLNITRENYRLAQNRVAVGTESSADLYRWESELANAKQAVLSSKSNVDQRQQQLNQILNRPINEAFTTSIETLDNPDLLISDPRITDLIQNTYDLEALSDFFVALGLERAPEIKQTQANLAASKRQLQSDRRAYWLPDVSLVGEYTDNLDEDRASGGTPAEDDDWRVALELSIPLYEGGARAARTAQSRLALRQLELNLRDRKNQVEQTIRNDIAATHASYISVPLAKQAEMASQKNYDLVASSYAQGARNITEVLDAQETLIDAREASINSVYSFLIDLMNVQRAIGAFDFFLTDEQRLEFSRDLIQRVNRQR